MGRLVAKMIHREGIGLLLCHHTLFNPIILWDVFCPLSLPLVLSKDIDNQSSYTLFVCFLETGSYVAQASLELIM